MIKTLSVIYSVTVEVEVDTEDGIIHLPKDFLPDLETDIHHINLHDHLDGIDLRGCYEESGVITFEHYEEDEEAFQEWLKSED
jgi:hypothetical protein